MFPPAGWDLMEQISIDEIEAKVDRLIAAYNRQLAENRQLKEQLSLLEERQAGFRNRLDLLLGKLDLVDSL